LPQTGFIDHIGIGVPDLVAAKQYYDDLMSILGLKEWFETSPGGSFNYGPDGGKGHNCSSTKQRNPAPTHAAKRAFITSHSWSRAARSFERHTSGLMHATPSSWTNPASSPSTGRTVLRPTGLIPMESSLRRSATLPKRASRTWRGVGTINAWAAPEATDVELTRPSGDTPEH
jgi:hypothetical protein